MTQLATFSTLMRNIRTLTAASPLTSLDDFILCDCTGGGFSLTLPLASSMPQRTLTFKKIDSTSNMLTLLAQSGDFLENATTKVLTGATMPSVTFISTSTRWYIQ